MTFFFISFYVHYDMEALTTAVREVFIFQILKISAEMIKYLLVFAIADIPPCFHATFPNRYQLI